MFFARRQAPNLREAGYVLVNQSLSSLVLTRLRRPRSHVGYLPVQKRLFTIGGRCGRCRGSLSLAAHATR